MTDYIKMIDGIPTLESAMENLIATVIKQKNTVSDKHERMKKDLVEEMTYKNVYHLETDKISLAFVPESSREVFDTVAFREAEPEHYDRYIRLTNVKPQVRITLKEGK